MDPYRQIDSNYWIVDPQALVPQPHGPPLHPPEPRPNAQNFARPQAGGFSPPPALHYQRQPGQAGGYSPTPVFQPSPAEYTPPPAQYAPPQPQYMLLPYPNGQYSTVLLPPPIPASDPQAIVRAQAVEKTRSFASAQTSRIPPPGQHAPPQTSETGPACPMPQVATQIGHPSRISSRGQPAPPPTQEMQPTGPIQEIQPTGPLPQATPQIGYPPPPGQQPPPPTQEIQSTDPTPPIAPPFDYPDLVPDDDLCRAAYRCVAEKLREEILNHSLRTCYLAQRMTSNQNDPLLQDSQHLDQHLLFVACLFHAVGLSAEHESDLRYEIESANAVRDFLRSTRARSTRVPDHDTQDVWYAIACHTSPSFAENSGILLAEILRYAILCDFKWSQARKWVSEQDMNTADRDFPRGEVEKVFFETVMEQALYRPAKAPRASWPGCVLWYARGWRAEKLKRLRKGEGPEEGEEGRGVNRLDLDGMDVEGKSVEESDESIS